MALNWPNINAITRQYFFPKWVDQVYRSNPLFLSLANRGRVEIRGGQDIREPLLTTEFPIQWVSFYDQIQVTPTEFIQSLVLDWTMAVVSGTISEMEINVNGGESRVLDIIAATLENMRLSMQTRLGRHLHDVSPTPPAKSMFRLVDAISATTPYGGIDPATNPWWRSTVVDLGGADLTFPVLNDVLLQTTFGNTAPDLIITTKKIWNKLWVNAQSQQRFPEGDDVLVGYEMIRLGRARIVYDDYCAPGNVWILNTDFIKLIVHSDGNFRFEGWRVPHNQLARVGFVIFMGQLLVNGRRFHARIFNVSES